MSGGTWLESVPYGGWHGGTPETHARVGQGQAGDEMAVSQTQTTIALLGGLLLITGGGAAVGWFIAHSKVGALFGALAGLGYSAANLAVNASVLAAENARLAQAQAAAQQPPALPPGGVPPSGMPGGGQPR